MATTKQAQPTPYDAEIAMLLRVPPYEMTREDREHLRRLREKQEIDDRAYCRAKAEDADLLAACEAGLDHLAREGSQTSGLAAMLRAALRKANGGTP